MKIDTWLHEHRTNTCAPSPLLCLGGETGLSDANVFGVLLEQALRQRQRLLRRRDLRVLRFGALGERELGLHRALGHVCRVDGRLWVNTAAAGSAQVDGDLGNTRNPLAQCSGLVLWACLGKLIGF